MVAKRIVPVQIVDGSNRNWVECARDLSSVHYMRRIGYGQEKIDTIYQYYKYVSGIRGFMEQHLLELWARTLVKLRFYDMLLNFILRSILLKKTTV